jgi:peroxiredoxin
VSNTCLEMTNQTDTARRRCSARLTIAHAILYALIMACALTARSNANDRMPVGSTALLADHTPRAMFALPSLDGPHQELARFRGRVILVHFFATWCEPCRAEMASLSEMQTRLVDQPFAILPISVAEADGAVRRFFAGETLPFAILLDRDRSVAKAWNIGMLPSTVVLDRSLQPRLIAEGDVDWSRDDVISAVTALLAEPPG